MPGELKGPEPKPNLGLDQISMLEPQLQRVYVKAIQADHKPIEQAEERRGQIEERMKLLNDVLGKVDNVRKLLPNIQTPTAFKELNVVTSNGNVLSGVADKASADFGKYTLDVHGLATQARALSNRFPDRDDTRVGTGYFVFAGPDGESREIFVDNDNATLDGIARLINQAKVGVKANVISDAADPENPFRLTLSTEGTGAGQTIEYPEMYFVDGDADFTIDEQSAANNARLAFQGFEVENANNEVKDLIRGVTLSLKGTSAPGQPVSISIEQDVPKTTEKMKNLVEGMNQILTFIQTQNQLNKDSNTFKSLGGDYGLRMTELRIRDALQDSFKDGQLNSRIHTLTDLGVSFNKKGTLEFDEKKFQSAVTSNYDEVVAMVSGDGIAQGLATRLGRALTSIATPGSGLLANQKANFQVQIDRANRDLQTKEKAFEKKAESLRGKLASVQGAMSKLQGQAGYIAATAGGGGGALGNLPQLPSGG